MKPVYMVSGFIAILCLTTASFADDSTQGTATSEVESSTSHNPLTKTTTSTVKKKVKNHHRTSNGKTVSSEDLVSEIVEMFQPLAMQKSIVIESELPSESAWADFDHERIFQVLTNLVGNAVKFTPPLGSIKIQIHLFPNELKISVQDSGPGISPEHQAHIFERFWQAQKSGRQGLGLGLSIAKGIVEAHRGKLSVQSIPGKGSCFEFSLPRWQSSPEAEAPINSESSVARPPKDHSILIIDDDQDLRQVIEEALRIQGYEVHSAENGESGIAYLRSAQTMPSLILLDFSLPGMNGAEFISALRTLSEPARNIPILLSSAESDLEKKATELKVASALKKPASLSELLATVHHFIKNENPAPAKQMPDLR